MRITLIQDSIHWADKKANLTKVANQLITLAGETDLVVLPEMFTTGFCTDQLHLAESMEGETINTIKKWAIEFNFAIAGSFIACENQNTYNRAFFVFPNGQVQYADKRHLFSMGGEQRFFTAGNNRLIVNYKELNICILVCYDLRFPVWSRNRENEYDLLIYVANFPTKRISDWDILLKARAIENQCYVCGVNRVGVDALGIHYNGHSALLDYKGQNLLEFPENLSTILTASVNIDSLQLYRQKFAVWQDADRFNLV